MVYGIISEAEFKLLMELALKIGEMIEELSKYEGTNDICIKLDTIRNELGRYMQTVFENGYRVPQSVPPFREFYNNCREEFGNTLQESGMEMKYKPAVYNLKQKFPKPDEASAVGAITNRVIRDSQEFKEMYNHQNPNIRFKNDTDHLMTPLLGSKLDVLAKLVEAEWPGFQLRVIEAWGDDSAHKSRSLHWEGRAADMSVSDRDSEKLGRLAQLAEYAGFGWVFYEDSRHIHASVPKGDNQQ